MALPAAKNAPPQSPTSPAANFTPRQEFIKAPIVPHAFGLVSFNGSEILRLANFPDNVTQAVRRALWDEIRHFREDNDLVVCEFVLSGRPFSGRSVRQEHIVLDTISAILSQQYFLVSSIDYGRIYLDKLTLVFSRALIPPSAPQPERRIVFGLSFVSSTSLRVVSPPLSLTPAILQVVRSAWPHGVVNEKRDNEGSYVFKLKGYSFFKQSTFEEDSLTHIFAMLRAMDAHGLPLVTSIVLGKRSRVQDFWIFSAPAPPKSTSTSSSPAIPEHLARKPTVQGASQPAEHMYSGSHSMLDKNAPDARASRKKGAPSSPTAQPPSGHVRSASNPQNSPQSPHPVSHTRNATVGSTPHVLRKPSPRPTTPTRTADPSAKPSAVPEQLASREKPTPFPTKVSSPQPAKRAQPGLPPEFPPYPPNSRPAQQYPPDHVPSASAQVLYSTSRPQKPVYRQVPSSAFQIPPPPPMVPRDPPPPVVQVDAPAHPPVPERHSSWSTEGDLLSDGRNHLDDLLPPDAFRNLSTTSVGETPDETFSTPSEMLDHFAWTEKGGQKAIHEVPIADDGDDGVARSPKLVQPDLDDPDDPGQRKSEQPLLGFVSAKPGSGADNVIGKKDAANDKEGDPSRRPTTVAAAAEVVAKSGYRPTVDVPMTDIPVPSPVSDRPAAPLKVIPAARPPPVKPIPSDGDQAAYGSPAKVRKGMFPWSKGRREQKEKEQQEKAQANEKERDMDKPTNVKSSDHNSAEMGRLDGPKVPSPSSDSSNSSIPRPATPNSNEPLGQEPAGQLIKGVGSGFRRRGPVEVVHGEKRMSID